MSLVSVQPNIVFIGCYSFTFEIEPEITFGEAIASVLDGCCHFFVQPTWWLPQGPLCNSPVRERILRRFPKCRISVLCNAPDELPVAEAAGYETEFISRMAMVNEEIFTPENDSEKLYRAVYNAKMAPFKRHQLASHVAGLALIYSPYGPRPAEHFRTVQNILPNAIFLNGPLGTSDYKKFTDAEVARVLNQSRVGLCLSAIEGGMWASIEYLLCGLPVVSTPSKGGRDVFYDDRYCRVVEPKPEAIAAAVEELIEANIDPMLIRQATLEKVMPFRARFRDVVARLQSEAGRPVTVDDDLNRIKPYWGWMKYQSLRQLREEYLQRLAALDRQRLGSESPSPS